MDTVRIRLYYDFASTLCYVSHRVLSSIAAEIKDLGVELEWRPIDLTETVPWNRGDSFAEEVREAVRHTAHELGVEVEMPDPWLDSRPASQVALATSSPSSENRWRHSIFESIFECGERQLTTELLELAQELTGTEPAAEAVERSIEGLESFDLVERSTREATALGVTGVPTLLLDNWLFGGVYDGESMVSILEQLAQQYREQGMSAVN